MFESLKLFNYKAKPADVLKKQPFQPVRNIFKAVSAKPFKLQLTERLQMRSEFDKKLNETTIFRKNQEEIRQRVNDLQLRKNLRKNTEFKARGNPFNRWTLNAPKAYVIFFSHKYILHVIWFTFFPHNLLRVYINEKIKFEPLYPALLW